MPKINPRYKGINYVACPTCGKSWEAKPGILNLHTGSCEKCSKSIKVCVVCDKKIPEKFDVVKGKQRMEGFHEDCGCCYIHCKCTICHSCNEKVKTLEYCNSCKTCWSCCSCVRTYIQAIEKAPVIRLEAFVSDFYMLSEIQGLGLAALHDSKIRDRLKVDESEIKYLLGKLEPVLRKSTDVLANMYIDYLIAACFGEMRHLCKFTKCELGFVSCAENKCRNTACGEGRRYNPKKSLQIMQVLFGSGLFRGSYGGSAWAIIAETGLLYFTEKKQVFLDHVVDLSHNGGLFLGKTDRFFAYNVKTYLGLLDLKKLGSLTETKFPVAVTKETMELVDIAKGLKLLSLPFDNVKGYKFPEVSHIEYGDRYPLVMWNHKTVTRKIMDAKMDRYLAWREIKEDFWLGYSAEKEASKLEMPEEDLDCIEDYDLDDLNDA